MITLDLDTEAFTEKMEAGEERPAVPVESIPPDCNPEEHLDWRIRYAHHLVVKSDDPSPPH